MHKLLPLLKARFPDEENNELLTLLMEEAEGFILSYIGRKEVPDALEMIPLQLAIVYYNQVGNEGETERREGGVARSLNRLPNHIAEALRPYRRAKVGWA